MKRIVPALPAFFGLMACDTDTQDEKTSQLFDSSFADQEILISVEGDEDGVVRMGIMNDYNLVELDHLSDIHVSRMTLSDGDTVEQMAALLSDDHRVTFAEPNYFVTASASVNDPYYSYQWNLQQIEAENAWSYGIGNGVTVAVLDTGVEDGGADGITNLLDGRDFYNGGTDVSDDVGHGTFVAGTVGQRTNNSSGLAGVAPGADILPVKVMGSQGYGSIDAIANGIIWATNQNADVINMSLGSAYSSRTMEQACQYAYERGVVLVAASGNEFASSVSYPAGYDTVIAVGASRYDGTRAGYSNTGSGMGLLAPGGDLSRDQNGDGYVDGILQETYEYGNWSTPFWEGTSMAAPHVAAVAALILEQGDYSPDEVFSIMAQTTNDVGQAGYDTETGYGLLNAYEAVALAAGSSTETTSPSTETDQSSDEVDTTQPTDTTAPTIYDAGASVDDTAFTIYWSTDEESSSYVYFEGFGRYGDDEMTTSHSLSFTGQLDVTYTVELQSTDAAGNTGTDGPYELTL